MTQYLQKLPKAKWLALTPQVIANEDLEDIEGAILESIQNQGGSPNLVYADVDTVKVLASADSPATAIMAGVPNFFHRQALTTGGLSDGRSRQNVADVTGSLWGTVQPSQWYAAYAVAADLDETFALKLMPWLRVKSLAGQVISIGQNRVPATGRKYGLTVDELAGGRVYVLSGDNAGMMFAITANNENANETIITISGSASLVAGDWLLILPPTNFRWLGDLWCNSASDYVDPQIMGSLLLGKSAYVWDEVGTYDWFCPLLWPAANSCRATGIAGGASGTASGGSAAGDGGGAGEAALKTLISPVPGTLYTIIVGAGGDYDPATPEVGGNTSIAPLLSLTGGALHASPGVQIIVGEVTYNLAGLGRGGGLAGHGDGGDGGSSATSGKNGFLMLETE